MDTDAAEAHNQPTHPARRPRVLGWLEKARGAGPVDFVGSVIVFLCLAATQFFIMVPSSVSIGGEQRIEFSEILFAALTVVVAARLVFFRDYAKLDRLSRYLVWATLGLGITWAALIVGRFLITGDLVVSITLVEYLVFAVAFYLIVRLGWVSKSAVITGALAFLTIINLFGLYLVIGESYRVRATGLLSNINVYIGIALLVTPILLQLAEKTSVRWLQWLALSNVATCVAMVLLSGSRFALVIYPIELVFHYVFVYSSSAAKRLRDMGVLILGALFVAGVMIAVTPLVKGDFDRARSMDDRAGSERPSTRTTPIPAPKDTRASNPDWEASTGVVEYLTHPRILKRSVNVLSKHWLTGTGRPVIYFDGWGYHPPHNLILELLVYIGVFGTLWYLAIAFAIPILSFRRIGWRIMRNATVLGYGAVIGFSLFQPLVTDYLVLLLVSWGLMAGLGSCSASELGVPEHLPTVEANSSSAHHRY